MKRDWLKEIRLAKKVTQGEVADACGISRSYFTQIELGIRRPSPDLAIAIADELNFDWTRFFIENNK